MEQLDALIVRLSVRVAALEQHVMRVEAENKKLREASDRSA
jgi:uncharacterized small protein (DUF1192 family)